QSARLHPQCRRFTLLAQPVWRDTVPAGSQSHPPPVEPEQQILPDPILHDTASGLFLRHFARWHSLCAQALPNVLMFLIVVSLNNCFLTWLALSNLLFRSHSCLLQFLIICTMYT